MRALSDAPYGRWSTGPSVRSHGAAMAHTGAQPASHEQKLHRHQGGHNEVPTEGVAPLGGVMLPGGHPG
jgi:hypothetical protein